MQILCSESSLWTAPNWSKIKKWQWHHNFLTWRQRQLFLTLFFLSSLVADPSFMSISSLVLQLWQFPFIRDWPEIRKSEIPPSELCPISGDWGELWMPNLARMSLTEYYWKLQNSRVTAFIIFELLRENQLGGGVKLAPPHTQIRVNWNENFDYFFTWSLFLADQWRWIGKIDSCVLVK